MKSRWWWLAALALLAGCEEEAETVEPPEAVAPVEVTADDTAPAEGQDVEALQARIRELEAQVASQNAPSAGTAEPTPVGGTQVAAVPEGTDPPAADSEAAPSTASTRSSSGSSSSRRGSSGTTPTTPDGLLGALLGGPTGTSSGRRGSSDDEEEEEEDTGGGRGRNNGTLNPVDVLFPQ
ncbi:MAG: hypothetical protein H6719_22015 [Sandaracinaceae bacterium]|nr:hypothetical protein [Sandaracinaceae bacterium]